VRPEAAALAALVALAAAPVSAQIYTRVNANGVIEATNVPDAGGFRLTYPGKGTLIHSRGFRGNYHGQFDHHIRDAAATHGVSEDLVKAVIQVESAWDHLAVSSKGARGLMQLMPATARRLGVSDSFDPRDNIFGGTQYLRILLDLFGGDVPLVLAAYNAGENAVLRFKGIPPYRETQGYVRKAQALLGGASAGLRSFAPAPRASLAPAPRATRSGRRGPIVPARPRVWYKWTDARGQLHVAETPPSEGITYATVRALP
jgi:soluble lytic murein transglycosylase-like protein